MYEIWYDYMKPKYAEKANRWIWIVLLCIQKKEDICVYIAKDFEKRFDTSNYEL